MQTIGLTWAEQEAGLLSNFHWLYDKNIYLVVTLYQVKKIDQVFWNSNDKPINKLCNQKKTRMNVKQGEENTAISLCDTSVGWSSLIICYDFSQLPVTQNLNCQYSIYIALVTKLWGKTLT